MTGQTIDTMEELVTQLIAAHDGGARISAVAESLTPADMAGVYAMQDLIIARLGPVGGWKVMAGGQGEPICAPIPANRYFANGAALDSTRHGFIFPEVEVAVTLGQDLPAGSDATAVEAAIASLHPALEMVASPFVDRDAIAHNVKLGDLQSNGAVVLGPVLDGAIRSELSTLPVTLLFDGVESTAGASGANWSDILAALGWLASHAAARGLPLTAGQVIITGSRALGPHGAAQSIEGRMGAWGSVTAAMRY